MDDIVVHGETKGQHDERLSRVMNKLKQAGITLNKDKCQFGKDEISFLGHIVSSEDIKTDPAKVSAIGNMPDPQDITELRRIMGTVNQLAKFIPDLAEITAPIRPLLSKKNSWLWG